MLAHGLAAVGAIRPNRALLAVAGPVKAGQATLTNRGWVFDAASLASTLGLARVTVVNDFLALATALPALRGNDLLDLGGGPGEPTGPRVVIGPGTGLGVAALLPPNLPLATEGGHATLPAHSPREAAVIALLRDRFGHVSAERCLSGPGLENLHQALRTLDGAGADPRDAATIAEAATQGTCPFCEEALRMFCAMLGGVAGDQALSHGATGGVFVAGGILPRLQGFLRASGFRARFEAKGRFRDWLAAVPTALILRPHPALLGLATLAREPGQPA